MRNGYFHVFSLKTITTASFFNKTKLSTPYFFYNYQLKVRILLPNTMINCEQERKQLFIQFNQI